MPGDAKKISYFVEYLTIRRWFLSVLPRLLRNDSDRRKAQSVCYVFDSSVFSLLAAKATGFCCGVNVKKSKFRLVDVHDENGLSVYLKILYQDLARIQSDIIADPGFKDFVATAGAENRLAPFLSKSIVCSYDVLGVGKYSDIWHALMLIQISAWHARQNGSGNSAAVLFINERPWFKYLRCYAGDNKIDLFSLGRFKLRRFGFDKLKKLAWYLSTKRWKALFSILRHAVSSRVRCVVSGRLNDGRREHRAPRGKSFSSARIGVEYWGQLNLERSGCHSDLFFLDPSGLKGKDLSIIFNLSYDPLDQEKWRQLQSCNIAAVALSVQSTLIDESSVPIFDYRPSFVRKLRPDGGKAASFEVKDMLGREAAFYSIKDYWAELLSRHNIKIYTGWYKYDERHMAIAAALRDIGGIATIYQRAYEPHPSPPTAVTADVVFGFSKGAAEIERQSHSSIQYHVAVGYLGDCRFAPLRQKAKGTRDAILKSGAKYILAFFDENTHSDSRWSVGHDSMRENYSFLLEKVLNDPHFGLVIKPKVPTTLMKRLGPVRGLLMSAEKTGRCFIFREGSSQGAYPPAAAALAADVAVHESVSAGTAGLESALAGVPTLLLDQEGWQGSPLYRLGPGRVVFKDWVPLWNAWEKFRNSRSASGFGDWSAMFDELDPFRDGRAAQRMGDYLKKLLDGLRQGLTPQQVMADAAEQYAKAWGRDKISTIMQGQDNRFKSGCLTL